MRFPSLVQASSIVGLALLSCAAPLSRAAQALDEPDAQVDATRQAIIAMGPQWNARVLAETARLYVALHRQRPTGDLRLHRNLAYGPDPRQRLDVIVPDQEFVEPGPIFIFFHDSDAVSSARNVKGTDGLLYGNVPRAVARAGGVGINATYRLGKQSLAHGAQDVRRVVDWVRSNVRRYGGDAESILLIGHGTGAMHVAAYLFDAASQPPQGPGVAGAVLGSGRFDAPDLRSLVVSYQGQPVPLMLWTADLDPVESGAAALRDQLCAKYGACPMFAELKGHNHASAMMSIDSADSSAMNWLIRFYHSAVHK